MIKVKSREEAWREADRLFPTDYMKDDHASANAGYPIYMSTADGNSSWISDLNTTLELSIMNEKHGIDTIRINIIPEPEISEEIRWSSSEIRNMCICNDWYTAGSIREYSDMLEYVEEHEPTKLNIYKVAQDILEHSDDPELYVEAIMFTISNDVVKTFYEVH